MTRKRKDQPPGFLPPGYHDEQMMKSLETLRCSHCLEPLDKPEPVYVLRSPGGDPDDEWEVTRHYCSRCVKLDPARKKQPHRAPPAEGRPRR